MIVQLVEKSINKIKINLQGLDIGEIKTRISTHVTFLLGFDTRVTSEDLNTGAKLNEILKQGAIRSSEPELHRILRFFGIRE